MGGYAITVEELGQIKAMLSRGMRHVEIARKLDRSPSTISNLVNKGRLSRVTTAETQQTSFPIPPAARATTTPNYTEVIRTIIGMREVTPETRLTLIEKIVAAE